MCPASCRGLDDCRRAAARRCPRCAGHSRRPQARGLPRGARLGTSSLRRQAQVLAARPDLRIEPLRGNVDTRLRRLDAGELDAIVLACAGLMRLGLESRIAARLDPQRFAAGGWSGRHRHRMPVFGRSRSRDALRALDDAATRTAIEAERAFARRLGRQLPIADRRACAQSSANRLTLEGLVAEPDGSRLLRDSISGSAAHAQSLGERARRARAGRGRRRAAPAVAHRLTQCCRCTVSAFLSPGPQHQAMPLCRLLETRGAQHVSACPPSKSSR